MTRAKLLFGLLGLAAVTASAGAYQIVGHAVSEFFLLIECPSGMDETRARNWAERVSETAWQDFCSHGKVCDEPRGFQIKVAFWTVKGSKAMNCFITIDRAHFGWMWPRYYACNEDGGITPDDGEIHVDGGRQP